MFSTRFNKSISEDSTHIGGLGFSVVGGQGVHHDLMHCLPRVKTVFPNGAADGQIKSGDVLLEVNAIKVYDLAHHVSFICFAYSKMFRKHIYISFELFSFEFPKKIYRSRHRFRFLLSF